ncbi:hypothetical protein, conserved [Eimeria tenella]|uniref:Uncharacterized protein n=1 Tax=Eimeria tenella TaxID=5802 RepID=U6L8S7_EIMTE|nr:hypothetical protein, conserved [Eimeria tenella]CDJ44934.1 hypothetical protein, conserved [Eimeria tenella]|eukprot:XP_013235681.1 hypothetical protein, conserved [Eimeria tenella]
MATGKKQTESEMLAEKLLQGWTMLSENCPYCSRVPLMRQRQGKDWCVACSRFAPTNPAQQQQQQQQQQQKQQDEEEDETSDSGSEKSERLASATGEPFELRGSFRLQATPEERLAACSAALKREGEAAAEALKQQHQQQQQQQECSPASTTAESVST